jgi:methyltransferase
MAFGGGSILLAFLTAQRLAELWWARHNEARLLASGGIEYGMSHLPLIVLLHAAWLVGLWALAYDRPVEPIFLALFVVLQLARLWVMATLGRRWTIRIIVIPGERLAARGPYRFLRHPNYAVVCGEIAVVPLALGLPIYALVFSILNAAVLAIRITAENAVLGTAKQLECR